MLCITHPNVWTCIGTSLSDCEEKMMADFVLERAVQEKLKLLNAGQIQTVIAFVDRLIREKSVSLDEKRNKLLAVSVWSDEDILMIEQVQESYDRWNLPAL